METSYYTLPITKSKTERKSFPVIGKKGIRGSMQFSKLLGVCPFSVYLLQQPSIEILNYINVRKIPLTFQQQ